MGREIYNFKSKSEICIVLRILRIGNCERGNGRTSRCKSHGCKDRGSMFLDLHILSLDCCRKKIVIGPNEALEYKNDCKALKVGHGMNQETGWRGRCLLDAVGWPARIGHRLVSESGDF